MPQSNFSSPGKEGKPAKPYPDFPLFAHASGRWAKKIRGKLHYFGPWGDWQGALDRYQSQRDDLHAGRAPRAATEGLTLRQLANRFLTAKQSLVDSGELSRRSFEDYHGTAGRLISHFGKERVVVDLHPEDFEAYRKALALDRGPVALGNEIQRVRCLFKYAADQGLIPAPLRFGQGFKRPTRKTLRKHRASKGKKFLEAEQLRQVLGAASVPMRAMILLGLNCGLGNSDCSNLPLQSLDLDRGWLDYPRPKTGIERRCPLWPETVEALRAVLAVRKEPKAEGDRDLVFITQRGFRWSKLELVDCAIVKETRKLLKRLGLHRPGFGFYVFRHIFETVAGESRDQVAVDHIMGHADDSMAAAYRERISSARLKAVVDHVHAWLWPPEAKPAPSPEEGTLERKTRRAKEQETTERVEYF